MPATAEQNRSSPRQNGQHLAALLVNAEHPGAARNPCAERWRSRACAAGVHGPVGRRTVPSTSIAPPALPPGSRRSSWPESAHFRIRTAWRLVGSVWRAIR